MSGRDRQDASSDRQRRTALSLILCSRNDQYMGNSRWRLQTTLNYTAKKVRELGREEDVEIVVTDWGSEIPLREVLQLGPAAARIVCFVHVPVEMARSLQKDSPFPEVLALNTAVRRARGQYIGRIDQDTLAGKRFLETFFELYEGTRQLEVPLSSALLFANVRMVPYRFSVTCPPLWAVGRYIGSFGRSLQIELTTDAPFYDHSVGIWLLHRDVWNECGGYDERMIYMNTMETDMIARLMKRHSMVDLGKLVDYDFYHLEHYHPWVPRRSGVYRKVNVWSSNPPLFHPNDEDWGLARYPLEVLRYVSPGGEVSTVALDAPRFAWPGFGLLVLSSATQIGVDRLLLWSRAASRAACRALRGFFPTWTHRSRVAWETVRGQAFISWPRLLAQLWSDRSGGQIRQQKERLPHEPKAGTRGGESA